MACVCVCFFFFNDVWDFKLAGGMIWIFRHRLLRCRVLVPTPFWGALLPSSLPGRSRFLSPEPPALTLLVPRTSSPPPPDFRSKKRNRSSSSSFDPDRFFCVISLLFASVWLLQFLIPFLFFIFLGLLKLNEMGKKNALVIAWGF